MKNKIFSVGIVFTFLLMAACSHKGAEVTSLNIPPGPDIAKTPTQQTSSAQTPSSPTAPPTGPTISNLPPPSGDITPTGEPETSEITGTGPISGAGSAGNNTEDSLGVPPGSRPGYNPPAGGARPSGTPPPVPAPTAPLLQVNSIDWRIATNCSDNDTTANIENASGTFNASDPASDSHPSISIPYLPTYKLCFQVYAEGNPPLRYELSSGDFSQTSETGSLDTEGLAFQRGVSITLTFTITDSSNQPWNKDIVVSVGVEPSAGGGTGGNAGSGAGAGTELPPALEKSPSFPHFHVLSKKVTRIYVSQNPPEQVTFYPRETGQFALGQRGYANEIRCPGNTVISSLQFSGHLTDYLWGNERYVIDQASLNCSSVSKEGIVDYNLITNRAVSCGKELFALFPFDFLTGTASELRNAVATGLDIKATDADINDFWLRMKIFQPDMPGGVLLTAELTMEQTQLLHYALNDTEEQTALPYHSARCPPKSVMTGLGLETDGADGPIIGFTSIFCSRLVVEYER